MEEIGKKLKEVRENKEISKEKVFRDIKIHPKIITALEEAKIEDLPNPIYVKNFIKEYANYLDLDPAPLLKQFSYTAKDTFDPHSMKGFQPKGDYIRRLLYIKRILYIFLIIAIIWGVIWGVKKIDFSVQSSNSEVKKDTTEKKETVNSMNQELLVPKNKPLTLKIQALQDTWIQVKSDGNVVFQKVLSKDKPQEFKGEDNFKIWVGKASKVKLFLNDIPLKPLGSGVMKNILIDRSGVNLPNEK